MLKQQEITMVVILAVQYQEIDSFERFRMNCPSTRILSENNAK